KNHLRAKYCNECGNQLDEHRGAPSNVRTKLHADIAHPINSDCRKMIQDAVVEAYDSESSGGGEQAGDLGFSTFEKPGDSDETETDSDSETDSEPETGSESETDSETETDSEPESNFGEGIL
ncbi:MAG: septation protein SpoVG family protein, partial [Phycisphaerae bacterium]|nr:septation protein SpoVG family protein [Phycisphaerae bacterium]